MPPRSAAQPHICASLAAVAAAAGLVAVAPGTVAQAQPRTVTVNTGSGDLNVRAAPSANSGKVGSVADRTSVVIVCHVRGDVFSGGPYRLTTDLWNRLETGGFVTDAMLITGSNDPVVPHCDRTAPARAAGRTTAGNIGEPGTPAWGALAKWHQVSRTKAYPALTGPPKEWPRTAGAAGWTVVERPEPRAIVVFPDGHVAWVDTVSERSDRRFLGVTELHRTGDGVPVWSSREVRHVPGMAYILLP